MQKIFSKNLFQKSFPKIFSLSATTYRLASKKYRLNSDLATATKIGAPPPETERSLNLERGDRQDNCTHFFRLICPFLSVHLGRRRIPLRQILHLPGPLFDRQPIDHNRRQHLIQQLHVSTQRHNLPDQAARH